MVSQGYLGKNINVKIGGHLRDSSDLPESKAIGRVTQNLATGLQIKSDSSGSVCNAEGSPKSSHWVSRASNVRRQSTSLSKSSPKVNNQQMQKPDHTLLCHFPLLWEQEDPSFVKFKANTRQPPNSMSNCARLSLVTMTINVFSMTFLFPLPLPPNAFPKTGYRDSKA